MKNLKKIMASALFLASVGGSAILAARSVFALPSEKSLRQVCEALDAAMLRAEDAAKAEKTDLLKIKTENF